MSNKSAIRKGRSRIRKKERSEDWGAKSKPALLQVNSGGGGDETGFPLPTMQGARKAK